MKFFILAATTASLSLIPSAIIIPYPRSDVPYSQNLPLPSHLIHQFSNPTWVENIAVKSTGQLLLTLVSSPNLYYVDPTISAHAPASPRTANLVHTFSSSLGVTGITEVEHNHFYVLTGNFSLVSLGLQTFSIYSVDLSSYNPTFNTGAIVKIVTAVPNIDFPNGLSTLDVSRNLVIISDCILGAIWLLDVKTGEYRILLQEPEMIPPPSSHISLGINGVRVSPSSKDKDVVWIYFDNTDAHTFNRIPLSLRTLNKVGPVQTLANLGSLTTDDFALDEKEGVAYLACQQNSLLRVPLEGGDATVVLGGLNETVLAGPTSIAIGRGLGEENLLYVTTNGGILAPINGTFAEGGKVVAVDAKR